MFQRDDLYSRGPAEAPRGGNGTIDNPEIDPGATAGSPPAGYRFPWPPRSGESFFDALARTWKLSTFQPTQFFRAMPVPAPIGPAVLYFLIIGIVAVGLSLFWQMLFQAIFASAGLVEATEPSAIDAWMPVIQFLLSPLFLLVSLGISFVVQHLILLLVGGARRGPGTTLRALSFSYSPALFAIVPIVGALVGGIWTIVLAIIGLREGHQTDGWRAATAVLLPVVALLFLITIAVIFIGVAATFLEI